MFYVRNCTPDKSIVTTLISSIDHTCQKLSSAQCKFPTNIILGNFFARTNVKLNCYLTEKFVLFASMEALI